MGWVIIFCAGAFVGYLLSTTVIANGKEDEVQEMYNKGFEEGFEEGKRSIIKGGCKNEEQAI